MVLRDYFNILFLILGVLPLCIAQENAVRCINPQFDQLVDSYLSYSVPIISVADAYESKDKYIFLDAREIEEYQTSHIDKAMHIGYDEFNIESIRTTIPVDTEIIIYCSIGYRSEKIGERLKKSGYQNIHNLYGSIFEWVNQHHPIFDNNGNEVLTVHTYNKKWSKWVEDTTAKKVW